MLVLYIIFVSRTIQACRLFIRMGQEPRGPALSAKPTQMGISPTCGRSILEVIWVFENACISRGMNSPRASRKWSRAASADTGAGIGAPWRHWQSRDHCSLFPQRMGTHDLVNILTSAHLSPGTHMEWALADSDCYSQVGSIPFSSTNAHFQGTFPTEMSSGNQEGSTQSDLVWPPPLPFTATTLTGKPLVRVRPPKWAAPGRELGLMESSWNKPRRGQGEERKVTKSWAVGPSTAL